MRRGKKLNAHGFKQGDLSWPSMSRYEAIRILRDTPITISGAIEGKDYIDTLTLYATAQNMAIDALRPVSREQVEKVWKGCCECRPSCGLCAHMWEWDRHGKPHVCEECKECSNFKSTQKFCEICGAPMTDEAVQMLLERLEVIRNGNL